MAFSKIDPLSTAINGVDGPIETEIRSHLKYLLLEPGIPHRFNFFDNITSRPLITIVDRMMKKTRHFDLSTFDQMDKAENHWRMMADLFKLLLKDVRLDPNSTLTHLENDCKTAAKGEKPKCRPIILNSLHMILSEMAVMSNHQPLHSNES